MKVLAQNLQQVSWMTSSEQYCKMSCLAKDVLNSRQHLNRWLTEEVKEDILDKHDILQYCSDEVIQDTCCRFCARTFIGPLNLSRIEVEELKIQLMLHYRDDHPEGWRLMQE